ncbi:MAG: outer membrane beta-barrel protein [Acidobacteriaceae bacterium]|nr:outer membrane beta-barrel protein [Acidobacteriaceae bacterium]
MTTKFIRNCATGVFLAALSAPLLAQSITPMSGDAAANIGFNNLTGIDNKKHVEFGFSGGINLNEYVAVLAEYNYLPQGSETVSGMSVSGNYQLFGGAVRVAPVKSKRVVPYGVFGFGYARMGAAASFQGVNGSASVNGDYVSFGGGASIYCGQNWGLRPEYRWDRQMYKYYGNDYHQNESRGTIALFYQWGGKK